MTTRQLLLWLERSFLAAGVVLAAWSAAVLLEARYFQAIPVPPPATDSPLPGEGSTLEDEGPAPGARSPGSRGTAGATSIGSRPPVDTGSWVARLDAPSVNMSATVLEGTDDRTLARGAGHIEETAFPGDAGNVGIAGHRDTIFRPVRNLRIGDPLVITTADRIYKYRIASTTIVDPEDVYVLDPADHPTLTLVTCYPFDYIGNAPRRFIVSAELVEEEARTNGAGTAGEAGRAGGRDQ